MEVARKGDKPGCLVALYEDGPSLHLHVYSPHGAVIVSVTESNVGPSWAFITLLAREGCGNGQLKYLETGEVRTESCRDIGRDRRDWCIPCEAEELLAFHRGDVPQLTDDDNCAQAT